MPSAWVQPTVTVAERWLERSSCQISAKMVSP